MTARIQTTCSLPTPATHYIADNTELRNFPPQNNLQDSVASTQNTPRALHPIAEQANPAKRPSLLNRLINFIKCKKPTSPQAFTIFGHSTYLDVVAIRRSRPGDESHIKTCEQIDTIDQTFRDLRLEHWNLKASGKGIEYVYIIQDLDDRIVPQLKRLKGYIGKDRADDTGLNALIDSCMYFSREIDMANTSDREKLGRLSTEIKQIRSQSTLLCKKAGKLFEKTNDNKFRNKAYYDPQKKSLLENIKNLQTELDHAHNKIINNRGRDSRHELQKINDVRTDLNEAAYKLNLDEYEQKLAVASSKIPRAKLIKPYCPTQSNC